jgi:hypothetical protein
MGGLLTVMNSYAASYSITQITDDDINNETEKQNSRGDVVWATLFNSTDPGWTLYEYSAETKQTNQISDNNVHYNSHQINSTGDVVWAATDGNDQEIYLYNDKTGSMAPLTDNDYDDTNPQISDNGDVSWLQQRGTTLSEAVLMRYDATTMTSSPVVVDGATRQGYQTMNAKGDIVWNAVLAENQQVLLYNAATDSTANISNNENAINSNQRIMNNGDIVWESYDLLNYQQNIMYYKASDASVTQIVDNVGAHVFGAKGSVAWVDKQNGTYTISTYDPASDKIKTIATGTASYGPNLTGVNGLGDVSWSVISGTDWLSSVYSAQINDIVNLTDTQGFGTFELHLADNGDVVWSLWDGTDYEVYSYQGDSGVVTQLSDNQVNDGIAQVNCSGTILWNRFDATDNELMQAVREPKHLTMTVKEMQLEKRESEAKLKADFQYKGLPNSCDIVAVNVNGMPLVNATFDDFVQKGDGIYRYKTADTEMKINFKAGKVKVEKEGIDRSVEAAMNAKGVTLRFGASTATDSYVRQNRFMPYTHS